MSTVECTPAGKDSKNPDRKYRHKWKTEMHNRKKCQTCGIVRRKRGR